jgi:hypothetical protein
MSMNLILVRIGAIQTVFCARRRSVSAEGTLILQEIVQFCSFYWKYVFDILRM